MSEKDLKKLSKIRQHVEGGTACTYHKKEVLEGLNSVLEPKCAYCRKEIKDGLKIVNQRKFHEKCGEKYEKKTFANTKK
ncbi:MAG: hypothetical protein GF334_11675 [Candidatus Altiarchaeales archaeon]|nr:hypothetical protein [Candidatus Altiarchaeales archaeon]